MAHKKAKEIAKRFIGECVFTGSTVRTGAHIFPVSTCPQLADEPLNIISIEPGIHYIAMPSFDWLIDQKARPTDERIYLLLNLSLPEYRQRVHEQLERLQELCEAKRVYYPFPRRPRDMKSLIHKFRIENETL